MLFRNIKIDEKLLNNKEFYQNIMEEINYENVDFALIKAETEEELKEKFIKYFKENEEEERLKNLQNNRIIINFRGEGIYDLWGYEFVDGIIERIDVILKEELEVFEVCSSLEGIEKVIEIINFSSAK